MAQGSRLTRVMEMPCPSRAGSWLRFTERSWRPSSMSSGSGPPRGKTKSSLSKAVICCCNWSKTEVGFDITFPHKYYTRESLWRTKRRNTEHSRVTRVSGAEVTSSLVSPNVPVRVGTYSSQAIPYDMHFSQLFYALVPSCSSC